MSVTLYWSCQRSCCHGGVTLQLSHRKLCGFSHRELGCLSHDRNTSIIERYGILTLGLDVMHINSRPFILSVSKHIKYFQCIGTRNKSAKTFLSTIEKMKAEYMVRGFAIKIIYADQAFATRETELNK